MVNDQVVQCALREIDQQSFGVVKQFLEIHDVVYENGAPKIDAIDTDNDDGITIVYFPVKDEKFYLALYVCTEPDIAVVSAYVESYNCVCFTAYSEILDFAGLSAMTSLAITSGHNKGDKRKTGKTIYKDSVIRIEPNPGPDEFEDKLEKLLTLLEQDKEGIKALVDSAEGSIQVAMIFHNGNTMLGGTRVDSKSIKRMADLNLAIDFDLYANGKKWV